MKLAPAAVALLALLGGCGGEDEAADAPPRVAARIEVAEPIGVAAGGGSVWVASFADDAVVRIDPETKRVVARIPVGKGPIGVGYGAGSAWSADWSGGTVTRIDPATNRAVATIEVGDGPEGVAWGHGSLWTSNKSGSVSRVDPATNREVARIEVAPELRYLAATATPSGSRASTSRRCTGSTRRRTRLCARSPPGQAPRASRRERGSLWVASYDTAEVLELDPVSAPSAARSRSPSAAGRRGSRWPGRRCGSRTAARRRSPASTRPPAR